jgi:hypothetical protein
MVKRNIENDKKKTNGWQSTSQKTKDWVIRTPLKNRGEFMCSGMVGSDIKVTKLLMLQSYSFYMSNIQKILTVVK